MLSTMADETPSEKGGVTLNTLLTLPVVKAVGFALALFAAGAGAREYMLQLTSEVGSVRDKVSTVLVEVSRLRADLHAELERRTVDQMTRTDAKLWGYELERANGGRITVPPLPRDPAPR